MKIYTKSGDDGTTGLFRGPRVRKDDVRVEAYGSVDELNAVIGVARATCPDGESDRILARLQQDLFAMGADLATPDLEAPFQVAHRADWLEREIDRLESVLPPLTNFILPTGTATSAALHHARVVCRRAERRVVTLAQQTTKLSGILIYLNRASDLLFVLARTANFAAGVPDAVWQSPGNG